MQIFPNDFYREVTAEPAYLLYSEDIAGGRQPIIAVAFKAVDRDSNKFSGVGLFGQNERHRWTCQGTFIAVDAPGKFMMTTDLGQAVITEINPTERPCEYSEIWIRGERGRKFGWAMNVLANRDVRSVTLQWDFLPQWRLTWDAKNQKLGAVRV